MARGQINVKWHPPSSEEAIKALQKIFFECGEVGDNLDPSKIYFYARRDDLNKLRTPKEDEHQPFPNALSYLDGEEGIIHGKIEGIGNVTFIDSDVLKKHELIDQKSWASKVEKPSSTKISGP